MATATFDAVLGLAQQLTPEEQARLVEQLISALEDEEDAAWARDYEARRSAGQLTPDEADALPIDEAMTEIEREREALRSAG
jgi:hypothetical protein